MKRKILLGVVWLIAGQLFAQGLPQIALIADGSETVYALSSVRKVVFDSKSMTVNMKSGASASNVKRISFLRGDQSDVTPTSESSVFVFPNPVKTQLTVAGVEKGVRINLLSMKGALLQNFLTQDNLTTIDVYSLQQGLYLLQIGDRIVKFVKQ